MWRNPHAGSVAIAVGALLAKLTSEESKLMKLIKCVRVHVATIGNTKRIVTIVTSYLVMGWVGCL